LTSKSESGLLSFTYSTRVSVPNRNRTGVLLCRTPTLAQGKLGTVKPIADYIGETERRISHQVSSGRLEGREAVCPDKLRA
jgi:hypothetical protein